MSNTRSGRTKRNYINNNKTKQKLNHFWFALTPGDQLGSLCFTIVCLELNGTHRRCVESAKKKISRLPTTFCVTEKSLLIFILIYCSWCYTRMKLKIIFEYVFLNQITRSMKVIVAESEEKKQSRKQTNKNNDLIYSLCPTSL